ncbi:MAG: cytochrome P450 [Archangium sp.]|nr:cytochrome P450 [Archangium sp.]
MQTTSTAVPGPRPWPLIGNLPGVRSAGLLQYFEQQWHRYGDAFRVKLGPMKAVVLAHPEAIKHVLATKKENYIKAETYDGVRRVIGNGILALEGEAWKARRALVQPAFHRNGLAKLAGAMVRSGSQYFDELARRAGTGWFTADAHREMVTLTLDVVVRALFGETLGPVANVSYEALGDAMELITTSANGIVLPEWVPTPGNRKFHHTMNEVEGAIYRVIEAGRASTGDEGTLLSMLLSSRDADTGQPLSDRDVRDEVFTMFVAGHETTALTLTWFFTLLEGHDDVLAKMRAEVDEVLQGRDPTFEDVPKLTSVRQVVDETLRLKGPVAMNARTAVDDDVVMGFELSKGDVVMPFFWGAHRHRDFWSDPERFDPTRFTPEQNKARHPWAYIPFSAGQRMCIGNTFSLVESVLLLAMLLRRFDVEVPPGQHVEPVVMATVRPSKAVQVRFRVR